MITLAALATRPGDTTLGGIWTFHDFYFSTVGTPAALDFLDHFTENLRFLDGQFASKSEVVVRPSAGHGGDRKTGECAALLATVPGDRRRLSAWRSHGPERPAACRA